MTVEKQIVVCHYQRPLDWLERVRGKFDVLVYQKGGDGATNMPHWPDFRLPNVGLDAYAYLTHILDRWDKLADYTFFCDDGAQDNFRDGALPESLLDNPSDFVGRTWTGREWDECGRLVHWGPYAARWRSGEMTGAVQTMAEWFKWLFKIDLFTRQSLTYVPGANFVASRRAIHKAGGDIFMAMRDAVKHVREPEEAYYVERSWMYALVPEKMK